ncbi:MAG TPA: translocation/assembly module TamB domain-containing protein, partial [Cytophagaceae bacterium]|nr:translocation/assembly module TamB domain-containing protein [Cytophagaceae bacterium]
KDATYFSEKFNPDSSLGKLVSYPVLVAAKINGIIGDLDIKNLNFRFAQATIFQLTGNIKGLPHTERLCFELPDIFLQTIKKDASILFNTDSLGIRVPDSLRMNMTLSGGIKNITATLEAVIPEGKISVLGYYKDTANVSAFDGKLRLEELNIGRLIENPNFEKVSMEAHLSGKGNSLKTLDAKIETDFSKLEIRRYDYKNIQLTAAISHQSARATLAYADSNLVMKLLANANLDTLHPSYNLKMNLTGANLQELRITKNDVRTRMRVVASFVGSPEKFKATLLADSILVVREGVQYPVSNLMLDASADTTSTLLEIQSDFLRAHLASNTYPKKLFTAIEAHLMSYVNPKGDIEKEKGKITMDARINFHQTPLVNEVLLPSLERMDSLVLTTTFRQQDKKLSVFIDMPHMEYKDIILDSLYTRIDSGYDSLKFVLGFENFQGGVIDMKQTALNGYFGKKNLSLDVNIKDKELKQLVHVGMNGSLKRDSTIIHILPDSFILNRQAWTIPRSNQITIVKENVLFRNFSWAIQEQKISITSEQNENKKSTTITFDKFNLSSITSLLNQDHPPAEGILQGEIVLDNIFTAPAFTALMDINEFKVLDQPFGTLNLEANNPEAELYNANLKISGGGIELTAKTNYKATPNNPALSMNIELNKIEANKIEGFLKGIVKETQGTFSGNLNAEGNPSDLKYTGNVHFSNLKFKVDTISTSFALQNEDIQIVNDKISFKNFNLSDERGNQGTLTGSVNISKMNNPAFDLQLTTKDFQLLNSTRKDNNLFYGKVLLNANIKIEGNLEMPVMNARIGLKKGTQLTLIIPDTKVDIVERKGVVIFENRGNPMDPITMTRKGEKNAQIAKSIDLSATLNIDPEAVFQIVIDERAGDMLEVEGDANLYLDISPNGIMSLTGSYKVAGGHYQMSLYNLVKRRFELKAGSTILWTGDPMGAKLDLTAIYNIKTSTSDLMSDQVTGADASQLSQYRQKLPFNVLLNINGELLKPQISFAMDMP